MTTQDEQRAQLLEHCRKLAANSPDGVFVLSREDAGMAAGLGWTNGFELIMQLRQRGQLVLIENGRGLKASRYRMAQTRKSKDLHD